MICCDRFKYHCYCKLSFEKPTTLASLVKGRWIDGTTQALILLLSACNMPTIFMLQTFLPSRRRDCLISTASPYNTPSKTALSLEKHYILASLVKGRWIDGKARALILLLSACDMPTIFILQTFLPSRRRDCFTPTNLSIPTTFSKAHQPPCLAPTPLPFNERSVCFASCKTLGVQLRASMPALEKG